MNNAVFTANGTKTGGTLTWTPVAGDVRAAAYNVTFTGYWARARSEGSGGDDASYLGDFNYTGDRYGVRASYLGIGAPLFMVLTFVVFFYCLGSLFDERKILFAKLFGGFGVAVTVEQIQVAQVVV